jgi:hypothetical protein
MWRTEGRPELYTYHQDQRGRYGDHGKVLKPMRFETGRWYAVSLHVRLNTPAAEPNGAVRLFIDGELVEAHEAVRLRGSDAPETLISHFLFSTFHGGNDPGWAPRKPDGSYADVHALFDNLAVVSGAAVRTRAGE